MKAKIYMKKGAFIALCSTLLLLGCDLQQGKVELNEAEARSIMDDVSRRNLAYEQLTERDDTLMQRVVAFYKEYGTSNEQMEAYYLLGSVYRDLHEAPRSMEAFLNGISVADTTTEDCRYDILTRLYAQKCDILYIQNLYKQAVEAEEMVYKYAVLAKDSLFMVAAQWGRLGKCYSFSDYQTIANECWNVLEQSKELGYFAYGVNYLCSSVLANVELGRWEDAKKLLSIYEQHSGMVDLITYECSFPIYYYAKGRVLAAAGKLDSAEYFYRRGLKAPDWDNHQAAYRGLRMLFEQMGNADSLAKYARLQCDAVDSAYQEKLSENIQNLQALYDYSRVQEDNHTKSLQLEKERQVRQRMWWIAAVVLVFLMSLFYYFRMRYRQKVMDAELELERANRELMEKEAELGWLRKQLEEMSDGQQRAELVRGIEEAEREVEQQQRVVVDKEEKLRSLRQKKSEKSNELFRKYGNEPIFKRLNQYAEDRKMATDEDYMEVRNVIEKYDADCVTRLFALVPKLTDMELHVYLLMRIGMNKARISVLISHERSAVSNIINRLYKKVKGCSSCTSVEADEWLLSI